MSESKVVIDEQRDLETLDLYNETQDHVRWQSYSTHLASLNNAIREYDQQADPNFDVALDIIFNAYPLYKSKGFELNLCGLDSVLWPAFLNKYGARKNLRLLYLKSFEGGWRRPSELTQSAALRDILLKEEKVSDELRSQWLVRQLVNKLDLLRAVINKIREDHIKF